MVSGVTFHDAFEAKIERRRAGRQITLQDNLAAVGKSGSQNVTPIGHPASKSKTRPPRHYQCKSVSSTGNVAVDPAWTRH
jgi:hypothetical protein